MFKVSQGLFFTHGGPTPGPLFHGLWSSRGEVFWDCAWELPNSLGSCRGKPFPYSETWSGIVRAQLCFPPRWGSSNINRLGEKSQLWKGLPQPPPTLKLCGGDRKYPVNVVSAPQLEVLSLTTRIVISLSFCVFIERSNWLSLTNKVFCNSTFQNFRWPLPFFSVSPNSHQKGPLRTS